MNNKESTLNAALRIFEAAEANLAKIERVWQEIHAQLPNGIQFGIDEGYENNCRIYSSIMEQLPKIDGWKPSRQPADMDEIANNRFDAQEVGEPEVLMSVEKWIEEPGRELREYRFKLDKKRRELIREAMFGLMVTVENNINAIQQYINRKGESKDLEACETWDSLKSDIGEMDTLLGSALRPNRWNDLRRHLSFGERHDFIDIRDTDWPSIKAGLYKSLYDKNEPVPIDVDDLSAVVSKGPRGHVTVKLKWNKLTAEEFERLIFAMISLEKAYENPEWLIATNANDKGRDLSVSRVMIDSLGGTIRHRVIIQCKHWLSKSISPTEISKLKEQLKLWEPPRIDVCVIATSGRFTADAVTLIEKHNQTDSALRIEKWPESHLEMLLASRPELIAEFALR